VRFAAGWMRLAETENCCANNNKDSCILPLHGGAIHTKPEGSTNAIKVLSEVIAATDKSSQPHLKAQWMLNMAWMTLGGWPDKVPEADRIPKSFFESKTDFPKFVNVADQVGIHYMNLAGGAIADDFDNDDDIDLMVRATARTGSSITNEAALVRRTEEAA
jgi:hypothetical protein